MLGNRGNRGNSGVQVRTRLDADGTARGYQADTLPGGPNCGAGWDESTGRDMLAENGQRVVIDASGKRHVSGLGHTVALQGGDKWDAMHITARGHSLVLRINDVVSAELIDSETDEFELKGVIGFQRRSHHDRTVQGYPADAVPRGKVGFPLRNTATGRQSIMRSTLRFSFIAALLPVVSPTAFALLSVGNLSPEQAKEQGVELRTKPAGSDRVWIELEFKTEGAFSGFAEPQRSNYVDLRIGAGKNQHLVTAALREDRSKPGRISVSFSAKRSELDKMELWLIQYIPGVAQVLRLREFVDLEKLDPPAADDARAADKEDRGGAGAAPATETKDSE